jgi:hypothetical protein
MFFGGSSFVFFWGHFPNEGDISMSYIVIFSDRFYPFLPTTNKTKEKRTRKKKNYRKFNQKNRDAQLPPNGFYLFFWVRHTTAVTGEDPY